MQGELLRTIGDLVTQDNSTNSDYQQLANVVILISLPIAGCTLAAGIAAGLADRKRSFSRLRLTGARLATLRRVVALEGAVPLLFVAAAAVGTGSPAPRCSPPNGHRPYRRSCPACPHAYSGRRDRACPAGLLRRLRAALA